MPRQTLNFNDKSSKDFFLYLSGPGIYDSPEVDFESVSIPGLNGDLLQNNASTGFRRFNNIEIKYKAFFFNGLPAKTSAVKSWLFSPTGYSTLYDSYDPDFFRLATCTSALTFDVSNNKAAEMELVFNCKPQRFSFEGLEPITSTEKKFVVTNPFEFPSQPIIRIYSSDSSSGILNINDETISIKSISSYIELDCETHNAKNDSGFCNKTIYSSDFPILTPGDNTIKYTGSFDSIEVIPRWWTL